MQAWEKFLAVQEVSLGKDVVNNWLRPLKVLRFDACNLYLQAADSFQALWFEEHIRPKLKHSLLNYNQVPIKVHITIGDPSLSQVTHEGKQKKQKPTQPFTLLFDHPDKLCTLDNFVENETNQLAYKLVCELCKSLSDQEVSHSIQLGTYNPVFIYGPSGTGKTHLLAATMYSLLQSGLRVIYARAETFTDHVVNAIRAGEMHLFRQAYRSTDVLIVDDVHNFARKAATQEEFFHTFNTLHMAGKQIILSSQVPPSEMQHIEPRLISRFEWGIVAETGRLPLKDMQVLLQHKCTALNFPLNPRTVDYILETFQSTPKALIKALEALVLRSHLSTSSRGGAVTSTGISANQARLYLSDLIKAEKEEMITPEKILRHVAENFGITVNDILGKSQSRECSLPRQLAAYLCRNILKMPFKKIGDLFLRDHSTIMSSVKQIEKLINEDSTEVIGSLKAVQISLKAPPTLINTASEESFHPQEILT